MGECSPINDTNVRGTFIGMTMDTTWEDSVQTVLEWAAFAIRDSFEVANSLGVAILSTKICGGSAKSPLWRTIFANILGIPLEPLASALDTTVSNLLGIEDPSVGELLEAAAQVSRRKRIG